uniref:HTH_Tnp_IS630 domain-containing protein n=1 Tax=Strongyloides venezuelensis TaxID=75913 RepID=A0A0K0FCF1_STRVS
MLSKPDIRADKLYEFKQGFVNTSTVKRWFRKFKEGNENLEIKERGRPRCVIDDDKLREAVEANPCETVRALAEKFNVSKSTISFHLKKKEKTKRLNK